MAEPATAHVQRQTESPGYFRRIVSAATSTFDGLAVTMASLLRPPVTVQYPDRLEGGGRMPDRLPARTRGFLEVDTAICTACKLCERACPIECIQILLDKREIDGKKVRGMTAFDIDMNKCMYCGLCVEPCPTGSVRMSTEFEGADPAFWTMVFRFIPIGGFIPPFKAGKAREFETPAEGTIARQTLERMRAENVQLFDWIRRRRAEADQGGDEAGA